MDRPVVRESNFVRKKGGGGQKVMTVLFIRENIGNFGRPLRCSLVKIGGLSWKYTKLRSGRPQANDCGCVCDLDKPLADIYVRK